MRPTTSSALTILGLSACCTALSLPGPPAAAQSNRDPRVLVITPARGFRAAKGTYSINPRPPHARGSRTSGDIRFITIPEDEEVHYYYKGGSAFPGVIKGIRARRTLVVVAAPGRRARFNAFVPVLPGRITTVKLTLPPALPAPKSEPDRK